MGKLALGIGLACLALAVIVLVLADGPRRWYSGGFFALMGVVSLANAVRWRRAAGE
jgi:hypothetical protein